MAEKLYLRDTAGLACGPGDRKDLSNVVGSSAKTLALDGTGDTWNIRHGTSAGVMHPAGTWTAQLYLKKSGFDLGSVRADIARYSSACVEQEIIMTETLTVSSGTFVAHTFSGSAGRVIFESLDRLMLIVTKLAGGCTIEYDQPEAVNSSWITIPDRTTVRPHEVYKRNRRRRSA